MPQSNLCPDCNRPMVSLHQKIGGKPYYFVCLRHDPPVHMKFCDTQIDPIISRRKLTPDEQMQIDRINPSS